jgi:hypothetical protein
MKLLETLLKSVTSENQGRGGFGQHADHHGDDHDNHDCHHQYSTDPAFRMPADSAPFPPGVVCRNYSTQTVTRVKFCHSCGSAIEMIPFCSSGGTKWPANALFCPQCGYKR